MLTYVSYGQTFIETFASDPSEKLDPYHRRQEKSTELENIGEKEINYRKRATKALCTTGHKNVVVLLLYSHLRWVWWRKYNI